MGTQGKINWKSIMTSDEAYTYKPKVKSNVQVKVPTIVVKEKEVKKSFWDTISKGTGSFNPFKKGSKRKIKLF